MNIMDFGNDDNFRTSWLSNVTVKEPWYAVDMESETEINAVVITEDKANVSKYTVEYRSGGVWKTLVEGDQKGRIKIHRFERVKVDAVRVKMREFSTPPGITEFGVYNEKR